MKLKMLVGLSGPEYSLSPGDERDFPDAEAGRLIAAGYAVDAEAEEPAVEDDTEDKPAPRKRKKAD